MMTSGAIKREVPTADCVSTLSPTVLVSCLAELLCLLNCMDEDEDRRGCGVPVGVVLVLKGGGVELSLWELELSSISMAFISMSWSGYTSISSLIRNFWK